MFAKEKRDFYSVNHDVAIETQQRSLTNSGIAVGRPRMVQADEFFYPRTPKLKSSKFQEFNKTTKTWI